MSLLCHFCCLILCYYVIEEIDVSDALKGLKALRREANKTLKALEGIDKHKKIVLGNMIDNKRTQDIISEIIRERLFE